MASLYRLDTLVRGNSEISQDDAIKWTKDWVNNRQEDETNKNPDGSYKRDYYADLFDSRTGKMWKVFSDEATENREIENKYVCEDDTEIKGVFYLTPYIEVVLELKSKVTEIEVLVNQNNAEIL